MTAYTALSSDLQAGDFIGLLRLAKHIHYISVQVMPCTIYCASIDPVKRASEKGDSVGETTSPWCAVACKELETSKSCR